VEFDFSSIDEKDANARIVSVFDTLKYDKDFSQTSQSKD